MVCPKCGSVMEDGTKFCSECGAPIPEAPAAEAVPEAPVETPAAETAPEPPKEEPLAMGAAEPAPKKPSILKWIILGVAAVLVLACVIFMLWPKSLSKVIADELDDSIDAVGTAVKTAKDLKIDNISEKTTVELKLSDKAKKTIAESLEGLFDEDDLKDLKWFDSAVLSLNSTAKEKTLGGDVALSLNGKDLLTFDLAGDLSNGKIFFRSSTLNSKYLSEELESSMTEELGKALETYNKIYKVFPKDSSVEKILRRYVKLALADLGKPEKDKDTVSVGEIEQKATKYTIKVTPQLLDEIAIRVLEELRDDKDVKKIIVDISGCLDDVKGEEAYKDFVDGIKTALDSLKEDVKDADTSVLFRVNLWVKGGEIIGAQIRTDDVTVTCQMPKKGSKFAFSLKVSVEKQDVFAVEGDGTVSGGKYTGEFKVKFAGSKIMNVSLDKFDIDGLKNGKTTGNVTVKFSSSIANELVGILDRDTRNLLSALSSYTLSVDMKATAAKGGKTTVTVKDGDSDFATLVIKTDIGSGKKTSLPKDKAFDVNDTDDIQDYISGVKFDDILKALKKAGVPSGITEVIEDGLDDVKDILG